MTQTEINRCARISAKKRFLMRKRKELIDTSKAFGSLDTIPVKDWLSINYKMHLINQLERGLINEAYKN